jgi:hypothetical protein
MDAVKKAFLRRANEIEIKRAWPKHKDGAAADSPASPARTDNPLGFSPCNLRSRSRHRPNARVIFFVTLSKTVALRMKYRSVWGGASLHADPDKGPRGSVLPDDQMVQANVDDDFVHERTSDVLLSKFVEEVVQIHGLIWCSTSASDARG